jgi:hypothetical protein
MEISEFCNAPKSEKITTFEMSTNILGYHLMGLKD